MPGLGEGDRGCERGGVRCGVLLMPGNTPFFCPPATGCALPRENMVRQAVPTRYRTGQGAPASVLLTLRQGRWVNGSPGVRNGARHHRWYSSKEPAMRSAGPQHMTRHRLTPTDDVIIQSKAGTWCIASTSSCLHGEAALGEVPGLLHHALGLRVRLLRGQSSPDGAGLLGAQVERLVLLRSPQNKSQARKREPGVACGVAPCRRKLHAAPSSVAPG
jgi:hypothetical protein